MRQQVGARVPLAPQTSVPYLGEPGGGGLRGTTLTGTGISGFEMTGGKGEDAVSMCNAPLCRFKRQDGSRLLPVRCCQPRPPPQHPRTPRPFPHAFFPPPGRYRCGRRRRRRREPPDASAPCRAVPELGQAPEVGRGGGAAPPKGEGAGGLLPRRGVVTRAPARDVAAAFVLLPVSSSPPLAPFRPAPAARCRHGERGRHEALRYPGRAARGLRQRAQEGARQGRRRWRPAPGEDRAAAPRGEGAGLPPGRAPRGGCRRARGRREARGSGAEGRPRARGTWPEGGGGGSRG